MMLRVGLPRYRPPGTNSTDIRHQLPGYFGAASVAGLANPW